LTTPGTESPETIAGQGEGRAGAAGLEAVVCQSAA
jgi:hypothetical protein